MNVLISLIFAVWLLYEIDGSVLMHASSALAWITYGILVLCVFVIATMAFARIQYGSFHGT